MNDSMSIDPSNVVAVNRWLDANPGISGREAARQLGINESYIRRAKAARPKGTKMRLKIADIRWTPETQPRVKICDETVERYAVAKRDGAVFPPPVVFTDGQTYWGGDGAHRSAADVTIGLTEAEFEVRHGTATDAYDHAVLANKQNGLPFNREDRKRIALKLIAQSAESNRAIAKAVGLDEKQIRRWRDDSDKADQEADYQRHQESATDEPEADPDPAPPLPSLAVRRPTPNLPDPEPDDPIPTWALPHLKAAKSDTSDSRADMSARDDEWEGETEEPRQLTDEEWLANLPAYKALDGKTTQGVFAQDALFYRHLTETDHYSKVKREAMADRKAIGLRGRFQVKAVGFFRVKHPAAWLICSECKGAGCDTCRRGGYVID